MEAYRHSDPFPRPSASSIGKLSSPRVNWNPAKGLLDARFKELRKAIDSLEKSSEKAKAPENPIIYQEISLQVHYLNVFVWAAHEQALSSADHSASFSAQVHHCKQFVTELSGLFDNPSGLDLHGGEAAKQSWESLCHSMRKVGQYVKPLDFDAHVDREAILGIAGWPMSKIRAHEVYTGNTSNTRQEGSASRHTAEAPHISQEKTGPMEPVNSELNYRDQHDIASHPEDGKASDGSHSQLLDIAATAQGTVSQVEGHPQSSVHEEHAIIDRERIKIPNPFRAVLTRQFANELAKATKNNLGCDVDEKELQKLIQDFALITKKAAGADSIRHKAASLTDSCSTDIAGNYKKLAKAQKEHGTSAHVTSDERMEDYLEQKELKIHLGEAYDFLFNGPLFQWLIRRVETFLASSQEVRTYTNIRHTLVNHVSSLDDHVPLELCLDWNMYSFMEKQYSADDRDIRKCIVYCCPHDRDTKESTHTTGPEASAYATNVSGYVDTYWPNVGSEMVDCIQSAYDDPSNSCQRQIAGCLASVLLDDNGLRLTLSSRLTLSGSVESMIDIAEAVIWLTTACRANDGYDYVALCETTISSAAPDEFSSSRPLEVTTRTTRSADSICWLGMVRNPVIAVGYPTPRRDDAQHEKGLEVSLDLLVGLSRANYATEFQGIFLLKGLISAVVPVFETLTYVVWHFVANKEPERLMTYDQACGYGKQTNLSQMDLLDLPSRRHFVGLWTTSAQFLTGTNDESLYKITQSNSEQLSREKLTITGGSITGGKWLAGSMTSAFAKKDNGFTGDLSSAPYESRIDNAMAQTALLYGGEHQQGWLVDGASALLHLVVGWLWNKKREIAGSLRYATNIQASNETNVAKETLLLLQNRNIQISIQVGKRTVEKSQTKDAIDTDSSSNFNDSGYGSTTDTSQSKQVLKHNIEERTFEDVVTDFFELFDQMQASRAKQRRSWRDLDVKMPKPGRTLYGWEASDIMRGKTNNEGKYELRGLRLGAWRNLFQKSEAKGWLRLARDQVSIVLLAHNFGDLIRPTAANGTCKRKSLLPKGQRFLAVPLHLLEPHETSRNHRWNQEHGDLRSLQLGDKIYWDNFFPETGLRNHGVNGQCNCDIVSFINTGPGLLKSKRSAGAPTNIFEKYPNGAAIIGRNHWFHKQKTQAKAMDVQNHGSDSDSISVYFSISGADSDYVDAVSEDQNPEASVSANVVTAAEPEVLNAVQDPHAPMSNGSSGELDEVLRPLGSDLPTAGFNLDWALGGKQARTGPDDSQIGDS